MCGIAGLFLKDSSGEGQLGRWFTPMLIAMSERGPDAAGIAVYRNATPEGSWKYSLYTAPLGGDPLEFEGMLKSGFQGLRFERLQKYTLLTGPVEPAKLKAWLSKNAPEVKIIGAGSELEIYKDVGLPADIAERYSLESFAGTCMIGHTRMATESAVNVEGSHPYTAGTDLCVVHNGSYSNHNTLRRVLIKNGITFDSQNDTEVAAKYIQWRLENGEPLKAVLHAMIQEFSGFFTLAIGFRNQFAVTRDPFACKPMVVAETSVYVACASEFRALAHLPGISEANIFEPEPEGVFVWSR